MKVITEERLIEFKNSTSWCQRTLQELLEECQELDTLTVTRLRPMSEAKDGEEILVKFVWGNDLVPVEYFAAGLRKGDGSFYDKEECDGFIPMPRYEPEEQQ